MPHAPPEKNELKKVDWALSPALGSLDCSHVTTSSSVAAAGKELVTEVPSGRRIATIAWATRREHGTPLNHAHVRPRAFLCEHTRTGSFSETTIKYTAECVSMLWGGKRIDATVGPKIIREGIRCVSKITCYYFRFYIIFTPQAGQCSTDEILKHNSPRLGQPYTDNLQIMCRSFEWSKSSNKGELDLYYLRDL